MRTCILGIRVVVLAVVCGFLVSSSSKKETNITFISPDSKYQITHARLSYRSTISSCPEIQSSQISFLDTKNTTISLNKDCFPYDFYLEYFCNKDTSFPCYVGLKENVSSTDQDTLYLPIQVKKQSQVNVDINSSATTNNSLPTNIGVIGEFETIPIKNLLLSSIISSACMYCEHEHVRGLEVLACRCDDIISLYNDILDCHDIYITDAFEGNCHSLKNVSPSSEIAFLLQFKDDQESEISKDEQIIMWDCRGNPTKKYCHLR